MKFSATTWTAALGGITSLLATLSTLSVMTAELNDFIPHHWRVRIAITSAIASALLKWINGWMSADKSTQQNAADAALKAINGGGRP